MASTGPVWHVDHQDRQARPAEEHVLDPFGLGLDGALRRHLAVPVPERVPADEDVLLGRRPIFRAVVDHGEATVEVGVETRQAVGAPSERGLQPQQRWR